MHSVVTLKAERYKVPTLVLILEILLPWEYVMHVIRWLSLTVQLAALTHISGFSQYAAPQALPLGLMIESVYF